MIILPNEKSLPIQLGAKEDLVDRRDHKYLGAPAELLKIMPSKEEGYSVLDEVARVFSLPFPFRNQFSTYGCVTFGGTSDLMLAHLFATGQLLILSARDAYSQIHLTRGAYVRDFYKLAHQKGICEDRFMPTFKPDGSLDEEWLKDGSDRTQEAIDNALENRISEYLSISSGNWDLVRQAIFENKGAGGGKRGVNASMGHFYCYTGYGPHNGYEGLEYLDSIPYWKDGKYHYRKWLVKIGNKIFMENSYGSQVILYSHWTAKKEYSIENMKLTKELVEKFCQVVLHREPDPEFLKYVGYPIEFVIDEVCKSSEWKREDLVARFLRAIKLI